MQWLALLCGISDITGGGQSVAQPVEQADPAGSVPIQLEEVEVVARRGSAAIPPETELGPAEIDALGAYDIGEVINRLMSGFGALDTPIIIVNGRRVADAAVFYGFPPDALARVELLPREAAALYGGDPSRRVLNMVLQRRFESRDALLNAARPTAGGTSTLIGDLRRSAISDNNTDQMGVRGSRDTALRAGERSQSVQPGAGTDGVTLRPASDTLGANLALTRALGGWSSSLGANARRQDSRSVVLIDEDAVVNRNRTNNLSLTAGLSGELRGWAVQLAANGQLAQSDQDGLLDSRSRNWSGALNLAANRRVLDLPAGPLTTNVSGQVSHVRSLVRRPDDRTTVSTTAGDLRGGVSIPLLKPATDPGRRVNLGSASLSLGAAVRGDDNAGRGGGLNAGLAWSPVPKFRFNGAWSTSTDTPSDRQRFDPVSYGYPSVVYDFRTGESVEILPILGGDPDLRSPTSDQLSLSTSVGPFTSWAVFGGIDLQRTRASDAIGVLPVPTPEVEAAFPERFHRDGDGRLISIDQRPINLSASRGDTLSSNLAFSVPVGSQGGATPAVVRVSLNHSWKLRSTTLIRDGLPEMDRLSGDGGGMSRHEISVLVDGRRGPWGINASARWASGYRIRRDIGVDGSGDLRVAEFASVDLRLSYLLQRTVVSKADEAGGAERARRTGGAQFGLEILNLFDARPGFRLADGSLPSGYRRDQQDPIGRTIRFTLKQRF